MVNNTVNGYTTDITKIAASTQAKIVTVTAYMEDTAAHTASGIIYSSNEDETDILTTARILNDADRVTVTFDNGIELTAEIIGSDAQTDLSLLKTTPEFEADPIVFTDSDSVQSGEYVIAIGGRRIDSGIGTVSFGVVSASGNMLRTADETSPAWIVNIMECDVSGNQSNSGAPIVNLSGEVTGILSTNLTTVAASSGMVYAVSSNEAVIVAEQLKANGTVQRGYLGVYGKNVSEMENYQKSALNIMLDQADGVYVQSIAVGSPADGQLVEGDIIVDIDGQPIADTASLLKHLYTHVSGDLETVTIVRDSSEQTISVSLE